MPLDALVPSQGQVDEDSVWSQEVPGHFFKQGFHEGGLEGAARGHPVLHERETEGAPGRLLAGLGQSDRAGGNAGVHFGSSDPAQGCQSGGERQ